MTLTQPVLIRLRFIDFVLDHYGTLRRSAIMDYFGLSEPQATIDIREYLKLSPCNMVYDKTAKCYRRGDGFVRCFP